jgi:hypothetical protein
MQTSADDFRVFQVLHQHQKVQDFLEFIERSCGVFIKLDVVALDALRCQALHLLNKQVAHLIGLYEVWQKNQIDKSFVVLLQTQLFSQVEHGVALVTDTHRQVVVDVGVDALIEETDLHIKSSSCEVLK